MTEIIFKYFQKCALLNIMDYNKPVRVILVKNHLVNGLVIDKV